MRRFDDYKKVSEMAARLNAKSSKDWEYVVTDYKLVWRIAVYLRGTYVSSF